jgi:ribosomal protein S18 acetylase RimI-like enzyme
MNSRNENPLVNCRFLNENDFTAIHHCFQEAFSDYLIAFQLTPVQLQRHILLNGVDLNYSVGCFSDEKMVGFTMNGFGRWDGRPTIYDAGTGVLPGFRRQGLSRAMFDLIFPMCAERGIEQCLLEVITGNEKALNLYENLGYISTRKLLLLEVKGLVRTTHPAPDNIEVKELKNPDWDLLRTFWDGNTSWQNSVDAVRRSSDIKKILGAFSGTECVGYIVFSTNLGRIAQMAVSKDHRNYGVGSALLIGAQSNSKETESLQVINIDTALEQALNFFGNRGFTEILSQYEMIKSL